VLKLNVHSNSVVTNSLEPAKCVHCNQGFVPSEFINVVNIDLGLKNGEKYNQEFVITKFFISVFKCMYFITFVCDFCFQFFTYSTPNESLSLERLEKKLELCQRFDSVLSRIDPGYSEIRTFIQVCWIISLITFARL
jgi:hypothetical protein